jgi:hypothetical protein
VSSTGRPDEVSEYAPRWLREGTEKPGNVIPLPTASQGGIEDGSEESREPVWRRAATPFDGDVRRWREPPSYETRTREAEADDDDFIQASPNTRIFLPARIYLSNVSRHFTTTALVSLGAIALGLAALLLFPYAQRAALQSRGQPSENASQQDTDSPAPFASRFGPADLWPKSAEAARTTAGTAPVIHTAKVAPAVVQTTTVTPQSSAASYVVTNSDPSATSQAQSQASESQPVLQPAPQPVLQPAPQQVLQPASQPVLQPASQPVLQPASQPVLQPASQPVLRPASQPVLRPAPEPVLQPAPEPVLQRAPQSEPEPPQAPQRVAVRARQASPPQPEVRESIDPNEVGRLLSRGEAFLNQGDVSAARLALERVAEAGEPRAALALGATYDPTILKRMGMVGIKPDLEKARSWYERAAALGSAEANQRLTTLSQLAR